MLGLVATLQLNAIGVCETSMKTKCSPFVGDIEAAAYKDRKAIQDTKPWSPVVPDRVDPKPTTPPSAESESMEKRVRDLEQQVDALLNHFNFQLTDVERWSGWNTKPTKRTY